jgi:nucleoside-diphosphate-sugar epimerase
VVQANLLAMRADAGFGEAFNIACGDRVTIEGLARCLTQSLGVAIEPVHTSSRAGDVRHTLADLSKARSLLGYTPSVDFLTGLKETVAWYRNGTGC